MSNVGYRNTAPARVFLASSIGELRGLETSMVGYKDIYDLANTLLSFQFTPADPGNGRSGRMAMKLVNPTRNLENILFSLYKVMSPRAQTPLDDSDDLDAVLSKNVEVANTSYVRWGYISEDPDTKNPITTALSEIHKVKLIEVDYDINNNQDRIVTINFVDTLDMDYRGMLGMDSQGEGELITFPIHDNDYKLRKVSSMMQELILRCLNGSSEYELLGRITDDQSLAIDETVDALIAQECLRESRIPKEERASIRENKQKSFDHAGFQLSEAKWLPINGDRYNYVQDSSPYEIPVMMALCSYFRDILGGDIDFHFTKDTDFGPNSIHSTPQDSLNRDANNNNGTPEDPNPQGTDQSSAQAQAAAMKSKYPVLPLGESDFNPLSFNIPLPPPPPWACVMPYYVAEERPDGFHVDFVPIEMKAIIKEGRALLISAPAWELAEGKSKSDQQLYVAIPMPNIGGPWEGSDPPTDARFYDLANYKTVLEIQADVEHAKNLEVAESKIPSDTTPKMQDYADTIAENESSTGTAPPPVERSHMAQFKGDKNLLLRCKGYIDTINEKILHQRSELINISKLEYSMVPNESRPFIEEKLGYKCDWENSTGAIILGSNDLFREIYSYRTRIRSFPIEVEGEETDLVRRISLATGFSKRKDNIVLNVGFQQNQAFLATALRMSPMINQKLYSISKRFEDPAYRDVVAQQLTLSLKKGSGVKTSSMDVKEVQGPDGGLEGKELQLGVMLPEDVADYAIPAAVRYSSEGGKGDSKDTQKIKKQISEDLKFILNNRFLDIFFPRVDVLGEHHTALDIEGEDKTQATSKYYRTMAKAPLSILQGWAGASTDADAVLLASKMAVLNQMQKGLKRIDVQTLGVPEMDQIPYEVANREVALWVAEPRTPGNFHWMTGVYEIRGFTHNINENGYTMDLNMFAKTPQTAEDLRKFQYAFLTDE